MKISVIVFLFSSCLSANAYSQKEKEKVKEKEDGIASFYHDKFNLRKTACGDTFYQDSLTAAHKTLPYGTWVKVTNVKNKKSVIVKVNDRLPKSSTRSIDLSRAAAAKINMLNSGLAKVKIEILSAKEIRELRDCQEIE